MKTAAREGLARAFATETWGVCYGRNFGSGGSGASAAYAHYELLWKQNLPMTGAFALAGAWSALTAALVAPSHPEAILGAALVGSFWPYAKWSRPSTLTQRW